MMTFILGYALFHLREAISLERSLIVTTASGAVKGKLNMFNGVEFYTYQAIPYAESTAGKMRFKPPVPKKAWRGILDGTKQGAVCPQVTRHYTLEESDEDCLSVNVYVPRNGTDKLLPVMVFVHGGALMWLSGRNDVNYGPELLLGHEIIYVSMNYRLGPFGFLSLEIEEASGNAGLKDVLLSLKWVQQNIRNFGGDVDKITIAGHSSGALVVNAILLANQSHGLVHRAIQISGSVFTPKSFAKYPRDNALAFAKKLGIATDNVYDTLEELKKMDALEIIRVYENIYHTDDNPLRFYAPFVISKEVESDHALFIMDPMEAMRKKYLTPRMVPILNGITSREAINMIPHVLKKYGGLRKLRKNPEYLIPSNIEYPIGSQRSKNLAKQITKMYFDEKMQNFTLFALIEFMSDTQYIYGGYFWMKNYINMHESKALYLYLFDFKGKLNNNQFKFNSTVSGIGHGDDVTYVFVANVTKSLYSSVDERSSRIMNTMINFVCNFMYYGNPTPENLKNNLLWPKYDRKQKYLLINDNPSIQTFNSTPIYSRIQFWEKVYDDYYEYVENGGEIEKKIIP